MRDARFTYLATIVFYEFLRIDELGSLGRNKLEFRGNYLKILIPRSKTDVYARGAGVLNNEDRVVQTLLLS